MPPNIHFDDSTFRQSHCLKDFYNGKEEKENSVKDPKTISRDLGRNLWISMLKNETSLSSTDKEDHIQEALSSIRILDCPEQNSDWLKAFGGTLRTVPINLVEALRACAPIDFTARVADFNNNLFYEMQTQRGLEHLGMDSSVLLEALNTDVKEYLGSFLTTETSVPQPPHVDYTWEILERYSSQDLNIGFFPLTQEGMFLQVWPRNHSSDSTIMGQIIYIPYGKLLVLPAHTIHGGGFRTTPSPKTQVNGNLRFHLYVASNKASLPDHQTNKYTEPNDKRKVSPSCPNNIIIVI
jgi:hypothetical protein